MSDCSESYSDSEDSLFPEPLVAPNSSTSQGVVVSSFGSPSKSETQQGNLAEDYIPAQESKMAETDDPLQVIANKLNILLNKPVKRLPRPIKQVYLRRNTTTPQKPWNHKADCIADGKINKCEGQNFMIHSAGTRVQEVYL